MNLIRLIVIGLIIWLLYRVFLRVLSKPAKRKETPRAISQDMVKCAHCGVHIPTDEAIRQDNRYYCSPEHRDAGPESEGN